MTDKTDLVVVEPNAIDVDRKLRDPEYVQLIRDSYAKGATEQEFAIALETARHLSLDPVAKQIFFVKRWDSSLRREVMATQVSIDGLRLIADRTGKYGGQTEPEWCGPDGVWVTAWLAPGPPAAARVGIIRTDFEKPVYAVARYASYVQTRKDGSPNSMWAKYPDVMLSKCSESMAFRKAFPAEMSNAYTPEEMGGPGESGGGGFTVTQQATPAAASVRSPRPEKPPAHSEADDKADVIDIMSRLIRRMMAAETLDELKEIGEDVRAADLPPMMLKATRQAWQARSEAIKSSRDKKTSVAADVKMKSKAKAGNKGPGSDDGVVDGEILDEPPPMSEDEEAEAKALFGFGGDDE